MVYWSAIQVCVWIATRDERLVARVRPGTSLFEEDERIAARSLHSVDIRISVESAAAGEEQAPDVFGARRQIVSAAASGDVVVVGRLRGSGNAVEVPRLVWANLEIRDHAQYCVIAASPDLSDAEADWWDSLQIEQRAVQRHWPFPRVPQHRRIGYGYGDWDDRPDTVAENAWARRRWRLAGEKVPAFEWDEDGLPPDPEITLVEAWSWCAFGRVVPHTIWIDDRQLSDADREYFNARASATYALRQYRGALSELKRFGARSQSPSDSKYTVDIVHRVAVMSVARARDEMEKARVQLAALIGKWNVIQAAYRKLHERLGMPGMDQSFLQSQVNEAEQALLRALLAGEIECLGRRGADAGNWQPLPPDCFRWPVQIRANHNILEPADGASVDQHKAIAEHVSVWVDLRMSKAKLKAWWQGRGTKESTPAAAEAGTVSDAVIIEWMKPIADRISAVGRQLRRDQFVAMLDEKFGTKLPPKAAERLWPVAVPEAWRKPSQGRLKVSERVDNWRDFENPENP